MRRVFGLSMRRGRAEDDPELLCCNIVEPDNLLGIWRIIQWRESGARWSPRSGAAISGC